MVASGEKLGMPRWTPSRPLAAMRVPSLVFHRPSIAPGGPGIADEFSTRYLPFGESAGFDHARFCALPGAPPRSKIGLLVSRSYEPPSVSPPLTMVEPSADTVWQVIVQPPSGSPPKVPALKSSGAVAPGLMRMTRPTAFAQ